MAIIKIKKHDNPYVILDKTCFNDPNLSWKAKGLHGYLMGLPADWEIRVADLIKRATDQRDSVYNALKELMAAGYLTCRKERNKKGHYQGVGYDAHETPQKIQNESFEPEASLTTSGKAGSGETSFDSSHQPFPPFPDTDNPDTAFPDVVKPEAEKPTLLINELTNNPMTKKTAASMATAAAFSEKLNGHANPNHIGEQLTEGQLNLITGCIQSLCQAKPELQAARLQAEVCYVLLNPKSFTAAGQDFMQKLNTIIKTIREGRWTSPTGLKTATEQAAELKGAQLQAIQHELNQAAIEREHWKKLLSLATENQIPLAMQHSEQLYQQAAEKFTQLQAQLQALKTATQTALPGQI